MVMIFYMMGEKWSPGEAQLKAGQHKEAIVNFTIAIESTPKLGSDDLAKAYYNLGVSELASGATECLEVRGVQHPDLGTTSLLDYAEQLEKENHGNSTYHA